MKKPPEKKTIWMVWGVAMLLYLALNAYSILKGQPTVEMTFGWGILMPILANLVWWAIAFRFRHYFATWWIWGIGTTPVVGIAGVATMLYAVSLQN